ncbi:hypothetical protein M673_10335 [Aureimonas sp. AU20]|nr:hypothetical protein M673_10335 [Aureimonas sp. AU20]
MPDLDRGLLLLHCGGDESLAREILDLMLSQIEMVRSVLPDADPAARAGLAHGLKGAARNCGASALAQAAGELESDPSSETAVAGFAAELTTLEGILRGEGERGSAGG